MLLTLYCFVAIVFTFLCSIMESVFLSITHSFVESYEKKNPKIGGYLKHLKANVDDAEGAILVLNTFATTAAATGVGIEVAHIYGIEWQAFGAALLTVVLIYFSEILPKTIGATYWKSLAPAVTLCIHYLLKITFPFVLVARLLTHFVKSSQSSISRDEILAASQIGKKGGSIATREEAIIENVLKLKTYQTIDILTPRSIVFSLPADCTVGEALTHKGLYSHSRIPIYGDSSNTDTIVGFVRARDILNEGVKNGPDKKLFDLSQSVYVVHVNLSVLNLLNLFITKDERLFVVQDRYGQFAGIVTLEDAIETLLGEEIVDEFDEATDMQKAAQERNKKFRSKYLDRIKDIQDKS